jgi:hypothetical protein
MGEGSTLKKRTDIHMASETARQQGLPHPRRAKLSATILFANVQSEARQSDQMRLH